LLSVEVLKPRSWEWNPVPVYRGPETQVLRVKPSVCYRGPETQVLRAKYLKPNVLRAKCSNAGLQARADCVRPSRVPTSYSNCTSKRSENICSSNGGAQENGKIGWNSVYHQNWWFSEFHHQLNANVLFAGFLKIWPCVWPNSGFWCCVCLTLPDNSN